MQDPRVSRRRLMQLALMGTAGLVVSARALPAGGAPAAGAARRDPDAILRDLLDGNRRFAGGQAEGPRRKPEEFATLAEPAKRRKPSSWAVPTRASRPRSCSTRGSGTCS